jgi:hypothetical protein
MKLFTTLFTLAYDRDGSRPILTYISGFQATNAMQVDFVISEKSCGFSNFMRECSGFLEFYSKWNYHGNR